MGIEISMMTDYANKVLNFKFLSILGLAQA